MNLLHIVTYGLGGSLILVSLLPLVRRDHWTFRAFEFPRFQKWVVNIVLLASSIVFYVLNDYFSLLFIVVLIANQLYLSYQIYPYLPLSKKQIQAVDVAKKPSIKFLIANVYQHNRDWTKLTDMVLREQSDIVLLLETDTWWKEKCVAAFGRHYEYQVLEERENTYGMLLFSKLELKDSKTHYWIKKDIPSIATKIVLGKRLIQLYAIHPEPPVPSENPKSTARDAEILLVGEKTKADRIPTIVAGDLNDVAWSYATELFLKTTGLLDPRRGRGFFSSFHAKYSLLRWPLDHAFCSGHFRLQKIKRMEKIGSDHFPILLQLHLADFNDDSGELELSAEENERSKEKIREGLR